MILKGVGDLDAWSPDDEDLDAADLCGISVRINGVYYACTRPAGHRGGHADGRYAAWARHYKGDEEYE